MSGRTALVLAGRAAVLLWIAAFLAWPDGEPPGPVALLEQAARIVARPEPPPAPEPEPLAQAAPAPAPAPAALRHTEVGAADVEAGEALLFGAGRFPVLSSSYEEYPSFRAYARSMAALGARFVVVDRRRIVGVVDPESGELRAEPVTGSFSPRARDYSGEPGLAAWARATRERFGAEAVVMMLVPRSVDAGLFGGVARALSERGEAPDAYSELRGRYRRGPRGGVQLIVEAGTKRDGSEAKLGLLFDLSAIARRGADA